MTRQDTLQELAALCRAHPAVALGVLGYSTALMDAEELEQALEFAKGLEQAWRPADGHLALVVERFRPPGRRG